MEVVWSYGESRLSFTVPEKCRFDFRPVWRDDVFRGFGNEDHRRRRDPGSSERAPSRSACGAPRRLASYRCATPCFAPSIAPLRAAMRRRAAPCLAQLRSTLGSATASHRLAKHGFAPLRSQQRIAAPRAAGPRVAQLCHAPSSAPPRYATRRLAPLRMAPLRSATFDASRGQATLGRASLVLARQRIVSTHS